MNAELTEFLRARLDEDEAAASGATLGPWRMDEMSIRGQPDGTRAAPSIRDTLVVRHTWPQEAAHIIRHDPARVRREVEADRKLVHALLHPDPLQGPEFAAGLRLAAMFRAEVWSFHPDYRAEWKP